MAVKVRLHVQNEDNQGTTTNEDFELTRIPIVGEDVSLEGGTLYRVRRVFHTPYRSEKHGSPESLRYDAEVWLSMLKEPAGNEWLDSH